jgi:hypothetical protein
MLVSSVPLTVIALAAYSWSQITQELAIIFCFGNRVGSDDHIWVDVENLFADLRTFIQTS